MAKFHIGTPGGYDVEVNADSEAQALEKAQTGWQSLPKVVANTEDGGRVLERGGKQFFVSPGYSTSDPDRISKILEGANAGQLSRQSFDEQSIAAAPVAARAVKFVEGVPFAGTYVDEALGSVLGPEAMAGIRALSAAMDRQRPGQSIAANLAGGLLTGGAAAAALPGAVLPSAAAKLRTLPGIAAGAGIGAGSGAVEGVISGAGRGTDAQSRGEQAQTGGVFGAVGGGLLGAAAPLATKAVGNIAAMFRRSDIGSIAKGLGISQNAAKVIKNTFDQGGDVALARANLQKAGSQAMLADAGEAAQALLDATATSGGPAAQVARGAVEGRATLARGDLQSALDDAFGFATSPEALQRGVRTGTARGRSEAYQNAFSRDVDWMSPAGERLRSLLDSTPPDVMDRASRLRSMGRRFDTIPDYSSEFAGAVSSLPATAEKQAVGQFFDEFEQLSREKIMKRPLTNLIKSKGGIDPAGRAAEELRSMGVTPKTHVGLFRRGGLTDLDNLTPEDFPESIRFGGTDGRYVAPSRIFDGLASEGRGNAVSSASDQSLSDRLAEMEQLLPEFESRRSALSEAASFPTAPDASSDVYRVSNVEDVDAIKRALDDIARTNEGAGLMGGQTAMGRASQERAREIRNALVEAVPEYGAALEAGADAISRVNAVQLGSRALDQKTSRDELAEFMRQSTGPERQALSSGIRGRMDEVMANVQQIPSDPNIDAREALTAMRRLTSKASKDKLRMVLGERSEETISKLNEVMSSLEMRARMARGSQTAARQAVQGTVDEITTPGLLGTAARGEPVDAGKRMIQAVTGQTDEFAAGQRQRIYTDIAKALTEKRGDDARAALASLNKAMAGQAITDVETRALAKAITDIGFVAGAPTITRGLLAEDQRLSQ